MAQIKLDPEKGVDLATALTKFCDEQVLDTMQSMYDAVRTLGDDNHCVEQIKEKMVAAQNHYNSVLVPAFDSGKKAFEEFTDVAEYVAKLNIDTSVSSAGASTVSSGSFDAMRNL